MMIVAGRARKRPSAAASIWIPELQAPSAERKSVRDFEKSERSPHPSSQVRNHLVLSSVNRSPKRPNARSVVSLGGVQLAANAGLPDFVG